MIIKTIDDENFNHYKKSSMVIGFSCCTFKCDKEYGQQVCQNSTLAKSKNIEITNKEIIDRYQNNNLTSAVVCAGLEPLDSFKDLTKLIEEFRKVTNDDIVVFTGYNKDEIVNEISLLSQFKNIIVKFGRFIPNQTPHCDEILGVNLASDNQFAERISK